jgi:hypothetical protein
VRQTADWLKRTMAERPAVMARRDNKVAGYTVTTTLAWSAHAAIVEVMLRSFAAPPQCYLYGSAYVAESEGGKGLANAKFVRLRAELPDRPAMTFVVADDLPSLKAQHKMGMQRLDIFTHDGIPYIAFRYLIARSIAQAGAGVDHHHGRGDEGNLFAGATVLGKHFAECDNQLLAAANDAADRAQPLAFGRRQQVDLELGGQHRSVARHYGERRIAAGAIGDGGDGAGMDEFMLLKDFVRERQHDLHFARAHGGNLGT